MFRGTIWPVQTGYGTFHQSNLKCSGDLPVWSDSFIYVSPVKLLWSSSISPVYIKSPVLSIIIHQFPRRQCRPVRPRFRPHSTERDTRGAGTWPLDLWHLGSDERPAWLSEWLFSSTVVVQSKLYNNSRSISTVNSRYNLFFLMTTAEEKLYVTKNVYLRVSGSHIKCRHWHVNKL